MKALKLDRYVLVGHSMGGEVAQLIASERPEKLSGLILVVPAMPGPLHFPPERREGMVNIMNSAALIQQTIDNMLTAKRLSSEVNAQVIEDGLRGSPEAKRAWPISTSQEDLREIVSQSRFQPWSSLASWTRLIQSPNCNPSFCLEFLMRK